MSGAGEILLVEDDAAIACSLQRLLGRNGYRVTHCARGDEGLARARRERLDLVLSDFKLPGLSGLELAAQLHAVRPLLPVIVMTAHGTTETAIEATRLGAYDYLLKPFAAEELLELVRKAVATSRLTSEPVELVAAISSRDALIGTSRVMQNLYKEIGRVATKPITVLIRGETGTGKELIARAIHQHSDRAEKPFIAINCAAIPETLLETELFGHERGAFTGAEARRVGRFEQAHGGTIFLDEVGELNAATQGKLLRVLQERTIQRLGGKESLALDLRVVAATHRDLEEAIASKQFRDDLYYRLSVVELRMPPLRERREDIPLLIQYFLRRYATELGAANPTISAEAVAFFQEQLWAGNVRELENAVRKAMLLARGYVISLEDAQAMLERLDFAPASARQPMQDYIAEVLRAAERNELTDGYRVILQTVERELYAHAVELAGGNLTRAANWLGVTRVTLREKLAAFGLRPGGHANGE
ncbi:MAG: sigma-54 dependent transcriptional regulator [Verrucomicrobiota bacterium]|nr:sigma-54 dependent transcriptional regulator [Verrucomicrobiota bacterium]